MKNIFIILGVIAILIVGYALFMTSDTKEALYTSEINTFTTEDSQLTVQYNDSTDKARVTLDGTQYELERAVSASGAKYESTDGSVMFWEHQGEVTFEENGETTFVGNARSQDENILTFVVGPEKKECVGVAPMECLVVNDEYFYDTIVGFDYEAGYIYELKVERTERENVPADASKYTYRLVEEVSKTPASLDSSLSDTVWLWTETQYNNDETVSPNDTDAFALSFASDGRFSATTDCNNVMGSYAVEQSSLSFGQMASTKKACLGDTQEMTFTKMLEETNGYLITEDGNLSLTLKLDTGSVLFTPVSQ